MKKNKRLTIFFLIAFLAIFFYLSTEPLYTPTAISTSQYLVHLPKYVAHKAIFSTDYKGNTQEAVLSSLASLVNAIEVDVRLSKDNIPFLYYGKRLEHETNGFGKPEEHTWRQLQRLHYINDRSSKILTLEELFELVGTQKFIFLDIKSTRITNGVFAEKITTLIKKYLLQENIIVESLNPLFLTSMRIHDRSIIVMYDFIGMKNEGSEIQSEYDQTPWIFKRPFVQKQFRRIIRPDILGPGFNVSEKTLKDLIKFGYPIIVRTINNVDTAKKLFAIGVHGIQSNKASDLLAKLSNENTEILYDAGGSFFKPGRIVHVKNIDDITNNIQFAKKHNAKISIGGRRHSMGGQTQLDKSIHFNMLGLNHVEYKPKTKTVIAGSGATWKKIQYVLNKHNRSVKVMQSDNIFTVGGSISVNVHGWQIKSQPIGSTILLMKVVTADGKIRTVTKENNPKLFSAIVGGYGLFGVIVEAELETVPNTMLKFHARYMPMEDFILNFERLITNNSNVDLAYGRFSVSRSNLLHKPGLFHEAGLFWYEKTKTLSTKQNIAQEKFIALKRGVFRSSQYANIGKIFRWLSEKNYAKQMSDKGPPVSRNNAMSSDIHVLWPLYGKSKDILHEYFVPKKNLIAFLKSFKDMVTYYNVNILNVTIREVLKDTVSSLPYAKEDVFSVVCLFSQGRDEQSEKNMKEFTQSVIDKSLNLGGSFYLPYRRHYKKEHLLRAYPNIYIWVKNKTFWDPQKIFYSNFLKYIENTI